MNEFISVWLVKIGVRIPSVTLAKVGPDLRGASFSSFTCGQTDRRRLCRKARSTTTSLCISSSSPGSRAGAITDAHHHSSIRRLVSLFGRGGLRYSYTRYRCTPTTWCIGREKA